MERAVFLDRDGVINKIGYNDDIGLCTPHTEREVEFFPNVVEAVKKINELGFKTILVGNQPDVSKGRLSEEMHRRIHKKIINTLASGKAHLDGAYYCFHKQEDGCSCRKPKPGMLLQAAKDFNIDLKKSFMIGDTFADIGAGKAVGCKTVLLGSHRCDLCRFMEEYNINPDFIVRSLYDAVNLIEKNYNEEA